MAKVFYARVSTRDQDLSVQLAEADRIGADKVFAEQKSGLDSDRPELKACLDYLREGDTLYVMRADRLGRSTLDLLSTIERLKKAGIDIVFTKQPELSTNTPHGELMLTIMAGIAKFETSLRAERQAEGIAKAREKGVKFGRKPMPQEVVDRIRELHSARTPVAHIAKEMGLSRQSIYRALER